MVLTVMVIKRKRKGKKIKIENIGKGIEVPTMMPVPIKMRKKSPENHGAMAVIVKNQERYF